MNVQGKVWGVTQKLFINNTVEVHLINAVKGGYCSLHYHKTKYNRFIVLSGKLKVTVCKYIDDSPGYINEVTVLESGMECTVEPQDEHMFEALEDTQALEIYYTELHGDDIVRKNCGGIANG